MRVQKASDLSSQSRGVKQRAHGAGIVEEFPLQLCGQGIPLHNQRGTQVLLFLGKRDAARLLLLWQLQCVLMIICEPLLIVRELGEAHLELLKFTPFIRSGRCPDPIAVFNCFRTILLGGEHEGSLHGSPRSR